MMKFGIIGYGSFGRLTADILSVYGKVSVYSKSRKDAPSGIDFVSFEQAADTDVVILCVGLDALDEVSQKLSGLVKKRTIVVDVSSVKVKPLEILQKNLGGKCRIIATHPLFGPQTVQGSSVRGENIVVCPFEDKSREKIIGFLREKLGLNVIEMSAEEHDKEMAWVHGLTFFVGRGLMRLNLPKSQLATRYYQKLLDLVELESAHSIELFNTVQRGNQFAGEIRQKFISELENIDEEIRNK